MGRLSIFLIFSLKNKVKPSICSNPLCYKMRVSPFFQKKFKSLPELPPATLPHRNALNKSKGKNNLTETVFLQAHYHFDHIIKQYQGSKSSSDHKEFQSYISTFSRAPIKFKSPRIGGNIFETLQKQARPCFIKTKIRLHYIRILFII